MGQQVYCFMQHFCFVMCHILCECVCKVVCQIFSKDEFQFCLHSIVGLHENLQKIMLKLMLDEIFNEWHGYYIIIPKFC
jgi:hypothetical protein